MFSVSVHAGKGAVINGCWPCPLHFSLSWLDNKCTCVHWLIRSDYLISSITSSLLESKTNYKMKKNDFDIELAWEKHSRLTEFHFYSFATAEKKLIYVITHYPNHWQSLQKCSPGVAVVQKCMFHQSLRREVITQCMTGQSGDVDAGCPTLLAVLSTYINLRLSVLRPLVCQSLFHSRHP